MSCGCNKITRSEYDNNMLKMYHSPPWVEDKNTRTEFDLDLQNNSNNYLKENWINPEQLPRTEFDLFMKSLYPSCNNL